MGCPKRVVEKRILGFRRKVELPHIWEIWSVERMAYSWNVTLMCSVCAVKNRFADMNDEEVLRYVGFLPNTGITGIIWSDEIKRQKNMLKGNTK